MAFRIPKGAAAISKEAHEVLRRFTGLREPYQFGFLGEVHNFLVQRALVGMPKVATYGDHHNLKRLSHLSTPHLNDRTLGPDLLVGAEQAIRVTAERLSGPEPVANGAKGLVGLAENGLLQNWRQGLRALDSEESGHLEWDIKSVANARLGHFSVIFGATRGARGSGEPRVQGNLGPIKICLREEILYDAQVSSLATFASALYDGGIVAADVILEAHQSVSLVDSADGTARVTIADEVATHCVRLEAECALHREGDGFALGLSENGWCISDLNRVLDGNDPVAWVPQAGTTTGPR